MSACHYNIYQEELFSPRFIERNRLNKELNIYSYVSKHIMETIIKYILTDYCNATVIGYEKESNKYWCKMYKGPICRLHIELEIISNKLDTSQIIINPIYGTDKLIANFVTDLKETLELYQSSSFIKSCLDEQCGL